MTLKSVGAAGYYCPTCKKPTARESESFPFCSERCRTIDLGHWATGDYRIAGEAASLPDEPEGYS